jgi:hypothetical protein
VSGYTAQQSLIHNFGFWFIGGETPLPGGVFLFMDLYFYYFRPGPLVFIG